MKLDALQKIEREKLEFFAQQLSGVSSVSVLINLLSRFSANHPDVNVARHMVIAFRDYISAENGEV